VCVLCSLQAVGVNRSLSVAYHVTETEFVTCRHHNSTVTDFTAYSRLRPASNYFIGEPLTHPTLDLALPCRAVRQYSY